MKKILIWVSVLSVLNVHAGFIALTDSFSVEVFDDTGTKTSSVSLTGSGAATGANLVSMTYGNFRGNGNELIVLRDTGYIEYYGDPLSSGSSLPRLGYDALENGGRSMSAISTVAGGSSLVVAANPDVNGGTYGYEYDGSLEGPLLDRVAAVNVAATHGPYISLAAGPDLHSTAGQDWAFLGDDGWVEIYSDSVPGGSYERISYFNAGPTASEIAVTDDDLYAALYENNTVQLWTLAGVQSGSAVTLDSSSTLVGFASVVPEPATAGIFVFSGLVLFVFRRGLKK